MVCFEFNKRLLTLAISLVFAELALSSSFAKAARHLRQVAYLAFVPRSIDMSSENVLVLC